MSSFAGHLDDDEEIISLSEDEGAFDVCARLMRGADCKRLCLRALDPTQTTSTG
jgi:hypothetical protein